MPLTAGTRLGPYEIVSPLGAGGMGEVYRARDTKLDRDVAIKILPELFAADPERLARFEREAKMLASLNHPHIAQIHGLEESGGVRALVMELVDGEDLAGRIARGPLPIDEVLAIATQIAEALEAAHDQGIVHRDLKPANIKLRPDGNVKVLDFGLAKTAVSAADAADSPTFTIAATQMGVIVGTAAYMAPEQARGKAVDRRADIWAFGCVLYEMLTARQAFGGATVTDILAHVVGREPDWTKLPARTPGAVRELLRRCLQKDLRSRLRDAGDVRIVLEDPHARERETTTSPPPRRLHLAAAGALLLGIGIAAGVLATTAVPRPAPQTAWSALRLNGPAVALGPRVSPDGRTVAFQALVGNNTQLGVLNPESGDWSVLTRDDSRGSVNHLSWSRDGSRIYFDRVTGAVRNVLVVPALGGEERLMLENAQTPEALTDGTLVVAREDGGGGLHLHRFWPETGELKPLSAFTPEAWAVPVRALHRSAGFVFFGSTSAAGGSSELFVLDPQSGAARPLARAAAYVGEPDEYLYPLAVDPRDDSVLVNRRSGDLRELVAIDPSGGGERKVLTTMALQFGFDVGADGAVYLDQFERPSDLLRVALDGRVVETLATAPKATGGLKLAADRVLVASVVSGRPRLLVGGGGRDPVPFLDTREETRGPIARIGEDRVAFLIGNGANTVVAIASWRDGRIVRRLEATRGKAVRALAAADARTLYMIEAHDLSAIDLESGEIRPVTTAARVAIDPRGRFLVIQRMDATGTRLFRRSRDGVETPLALPPGIELNSLSLWPGSLAPDGGLALAVAWPDAWFWSVAVIDSTGRRVTRLNTGLAADVAYSIEWDDAGHLIVLAKQVKSSLWRFTAAAE